MLEKIIDWSVNNKFFVILATVFVTLAGVYVLTFLFLVAGSLVILIFQPVAGG